MVVFFRDVHAGDIVELDAPAGTRQIALKEPQPLRDSAGKPMGVLWPISNQPGELFMGAEENSILFCVRAAGDRPDHGNRIRP